MPANHEMVTSLTLMPTYTSELSEVSLFYRGGVAQMLVAPIFTNSIPPMSNVFCIYLARNPIDRYSLSPHEGLMWMGVLTGVSGYVGRKQIPARQVYRF